MLFVTRASITPTVRISDVNLELFKVFGKWNIFEARIKKNYLDIIENFVKLLQVLHYQQNNLT